MALFQGVSSALLGEYRANPTSQHLIEELLLVINAIASGLRTTG
jgi:phosphoenolpyruvate carboxylase